LLEINDYANTDTYSKMTDEELIRERDKLLQMLNADKGDSDADN